MKENDPMDFYRELTDGTDQYKSIELSLQSGRSLPNVELHPVSKETLASIINRLPDEMFDAVDEADSTEEAEEMIEEETDMSMNSIDEDTVKAFKKLCKDSMRHNSLAPAEMRAVVENLNFEVLFGVGTEVIEMSSENDGAVTDFHVQE